MIANKLSYLAGFLYLGAFHHDGARVSAFHVPLQHTFSSNRNRNLSDGNLSIGSKIVKAQEVVTTALKAYDLSSQEGEVESQEDNKNKIPQARRPVVESGLRYRSDDWLGNFISIPHSFVLRRIRFHLQFNTLVSVMVVILNKIGLNLRIPLVGHSLLGSFLGLLLVFRTNSAYARFWEARGIWTKASSISRTTALNIVNHINDHSPKSAKKLMILLRQFPEVLAVASLPSGSATLNPEIVDLVGGKEYVDRSDIPISTLLFHKMHKVVHEATKESPTSESNYVEAMHLVEVSHLIGSLSDCVSNVEKIIKTPVPLSYSRHTSRFLTIWSGTLPLALVGQMGLLTLPVVAITCWCLFGIEEIGHLIEQPFVGDQTVDNYELTNTSFLRGNKPLARRAIQTKPYDIGLPVRNFAESIKQEIEGLAEMANLAIGF